MLSLRWQTVSYGIFVHTKQKRDIQIFKKTVRYTKHLKTGPKLDLEFLSNTMSKAKTRKLELTSWCVHHIHGCTGMRKERIYQYINNELNKTEFLLIYSKSEKKEEWNLQWIHKTVPPTSRNKRETWRTVELWYLRSHETEKRYKNL